MIENLAVVGELVCLNDPESYVVGRLVETGRASQAEQVEG